MQPKKVAVLIIFDIICDQCGLMEKQDWVLIFSGYFIIYFEYAKNILWENTRSTTNCVQDVFVIAALKD